MEQKIANLPMETGSTPACLETCPACHRSTPFTAAILAGLPLGQICTCALELRVIERQAGRSRQCAPRVEGH